MINWKVKIKLRRTKHCALAEAGIENSDTNSNNIIFTIKDAKSYNPVAPLSAKDNQELFLEKITEMRPKFSEGSVTFLQKIATYEEARVKVTYIQLNNKSLHQN